MRERNGSRTQGTSDWCERRLARLAVDQHRPLYTTLDPDPTAWRSTWQLVELVYISIGTEVVRSFTHHISTLHRSFAYQNQPSRQGLKISLAIAMPPRRVSRGRSARAQHNQLQQLRESERIAREIEAEEAEEAIRDKVIGLLESVTDEESLKWAIEDAKSQNLTPAELASTYHTRTSILLCFTRPEHRARYSQRQHELNRVKFRLVHDQPIKMATKQRKSQPPRDNNICRRCQDRIPAITLRTEPLCPACFIKYVQTKVVKRLETFRLRNARSDQPPAILLALSLGVCSVSMLHILSDRLRGQIERSGRAADGTFGISHRRCISESLLNRRE